MSHKLAWSHSVSHGEEWQKERRVMILRKMAQVLADAKKAAAVPQSQFPVD